MRNAAAFAFLEQLHHELAKSLPNPELLRSQVREIVAASQHDPKAKHKRQPEDAFLHEFALPRLFAHLQTALGLTPPEARQSLLSEYYRNMPDFCSGTPARTSRHPFHKMFGVKPHTVMDQWKGESGSPLRQSCPDFALRSPCPFTVVFEGKYFETGGKTKAESDLVSNIYQAFFYRSLPHIEATKRSPEWSYEFGCLLACDASKSGSLKAAWDDLDKTVKVGFWEGANVYVMIVRGKADD
jgi:hypothetical protein